MAIWLADGETLPSLDEAETLARRIRFVWGGRLSGARPGFALTRRPVGPS